MDTCQQCGKAFTATRGWQKFCNERCRRRFHRGEYADLGRHQKVVAEIRRLIESLVESDADMEATDGQ